MQQHRRFSPVWRVALLAPLVFAACGTDDDGLTDERGDLNEDFGSVPGATVESPALSDTTLATTGSPPFGTVSVAEEVYRVDGFVEDGGDFTSCVIEPDDRDDFVDITAQLDQRTFTFNVVQGNASAAVEASSTVVDDYEIVDDGVRGTAEFDNGSVAFDITC